mmetsp:Transcript_3484/g.10144  ORF Transcript_3484/g.10144 Transcript_3484/m.10144 type:complete len:289 (-) Transcript_3484:1104-1970(-)
MLKLPNVRWSSAILPQAVARWDSNCRETSDSTFSNASALSFCFSSSLSSSLPCARSMATPLSIRRTSGTSCATACSNSLSCFSNLSNSLITDPVFRPACCSIKRLAAEPSSASLPWEFRDSTQALRSCKTEFLSTVTAWHWEPMRCSKPTMCATALGQASLQLLHAEVPSDWMRKSCIDNSRSPLASNNWIRRFFSSSAFCLIFSASCAKAFRSSSCCLDAFSLSSQVCFMNFSISSICASYLDTSGLVEACIANFAFKASTSSSNLAICSDSSFFVALTLIVFARFA